MKKASWIVLTIAGLAVLLISLVSAAHAYNKGDNYGIGGTRVSEVAAGRETVASALRGIRGTSAAFAAAYGVLFPVPRYQARPLGGGQPFRLHRGGSPARCPPPPGPVAMRAPRRRG